MDNKKKLTNEDWNVKYDILLEHIMGEICDFEHLYDEDGYAVIVFLIHHILENYGLSYIEQLGTLDSIKAKIIKEWDEGEEPNDIRIPILKDKN
ncbi:MAG TPA: hypothetical protein VMZ91_04480 [Candidatus Paceibacterota bacterium]|nr:hypothetical protein [Candidatus Paceibacterota bacterium]